MALLGFATVLVSESQCSNSRCSNKGSAHWVHRSGNQWYQTKINDIIWCARTNASYSRSLFGGPSCVIRCVAMLLLTQPFLFGGHVAKTCQRTYKQILTWPVIPSLFAWFSCIWQSLTSNGNHWYPIKINDIHTVIWSYPKSMIRDRTIGVAHRAHTLPLHIWGSNRQNLPLLLWGSRQRWPALAYLWFKRR